MEGYKVCIYRLTENKEATDEYKRERSEEIFEQKVEILDVRAVIAVVNNIDIPALQPYPYPQEAT